MNMKKFFLSLLITILILLVGFSALTLFPLGNGTPKDFLDENEGSRENLLVVGVDKDGVRADVIMLLCTDSKEKSVNMISIPRDTKITLQNGKSSKINACLGKEDGDALLVDKVRELTGLPVNSYCKINFEGLRNIFDILGGVKYDVPIDMDYDDPVQDLHIHLKAGPQLLDGADIEGLLRFRSGYANADLGRIDTQQDFLKEAIKQKLSFKYIFKFPAVMKEVNTHFDTDLSALDVLSLAFNCRGGKNFNTITLPGKPKYIGGASYYIAADNAKEQIGTLLGTAPAPSGLSDKVIE